MLLTLSPPLGCVLFPMLLDEAAFPCSRVLDFPIPWLSAESGILSQNQ